MTYQKEGISAFYRGLLPAVVSTIPHAGTSLFSYHVAKEYLCELAQTREPSTKILIASAALSTFFGQSVSTPLSVVKTRMALGTYAGNDFRGSFLQITKKMWQVEGNSLLECYFYLSLLRRTSRVFSRIRSYSCKSSSCPYHFVWRV